MKSRQAALMKDLARLLTKYSARDWQPFVRLFTSDPTLLLEAMSGGKAKTSKTSIKQSRTTKRRSSPKKPTQKNSKLKPKAKGSSTSPKTVEPLQADAFYRRVLARASIGDLQTLYLRAYNNKQIPKGRTELTASLDKYLRKLPESDRERVLVQLSNALDDDPTETYRRWIDIISKGRRESER